MASLKLVGGLAFISAPSSFGDFVHGIRAHAHGHALVRAQRVDGHGKRRDDAVDGGLLEQQRLAAAGRFHFAVGDLGDFEFGGDGLGNAFEFARRSRALTKSRKESKAIPGDGNSTQGSELSHMHYRNDENFSRGYEWWLMQEAKRRNPAITLDGVAWGCPRWVGNNNFWSQDMCDYYAKWIKGLKSVYGLDFDAIGCRNEKGVNEYFVKRLRRTLDSNGLENVRIHGFDNWGKTKWDWCKELQTDAELRQAVAILSNHTISEVPVTPEVRQLSQEYDKPIWNTEEHVYKKGFDCEISLVKAFNDNYVGSGVTKVLCWYLETSTYPIEPFFDVTTLVAASPWSGHYTVNPALWAYAHYGQFVKVGWKYLDGACGRLSGGGSYVTLASGPDYSIIIETKGCTENQKVTIKVTGGLATGKVCVWRSNQQEQFVKVEDLTPAGGLFSLTLEPNSIYSLSTTTGQQKGSFTDVPVPARFPFPYHETFDHYGEAKTWGYLPHYTADIDGGFELANRPDGSGQCLRQVVDQKAQSWAPEWMPYTILGDEQWTDYEVSADVCLDEGGWAGLLGRVNNTGNGYGCNPKGYYLRVDADGHCSLYASTQTKNGDPGRQLVISAANRRPAIFLPSIHFPSRHFRLAEIVERHALDDFKILAVAADADN
jgi:galactosylceramidase